MVKRIDMINDINGKRETSKLAVRIIVLCFFPKSWF